jgi:hypothetical protein
MTQSDTRRLHCPRDIRSTAQQRRLRTEQVLIVVIEQLGCDRLSGHPVRTVSANRCPSFNGRETDRPLPLRPNAHRNAAEMRRRFWCEEIVIHLRRRAGFSCRSERRGRSEKAGRWGNARPKSCRSRCPRAARGCAGQSQLTPLAYRAPRDIFRASSRPRTLRRARCRMQPIRRPASRPLSGPAFGRPTKP